MNEPVLPSSVPRPFNLRFVLLMSCGIPLVAWLLHVPEGNGSPNNLRLKPPGKAGEPVMQVMAVPEPVPSAAAAAPVVRVAGAAPRLLEVGSGKSEE